MRWIMQIICPVTGESSPFSGQYLKEYDPERDGVSPDGREMRMHLVTTPDPAQARQFDSVFDLLDTWKQDCVREPFLLDGHPNRPLSWFTVGTIPVLEGSEISS